MEWNDSIKDPQAEILRLNGLIQKDPKNARAYYDLGVVYEHVHDSLKAIECCQKAIALEADNPLYYAFLVFLYSAREPEPELALDAVAKLAELGPDESDYEI